MTTEFPPLLPGDAPEILRRALAFARSGGDTLALEAQVAALDLGARLAAAGRDPKLLPAVLAALAARTRVGRHIEADRGGYHHAFADAVRVLLEEGAEVTAAVRALVAHPDLRIRAALVDGITPDAPHFVDLLERLAGDREISVRDRAKAALQAIAPPPWWTGVFPRDPAPLLDEAQARDLGPTLARWAELRNERYGRKATGAELTTLLDALPDVLAADVLPGLVEGHEVSPEALAFRTLRCPGWAELAIRILVTVEPHARYRFGDALLGARAKDAAAARAFLAAARARPAHEPTDVMSVAGFLARIAETCWPPGEDATPDLAALLEDPAPDRLSRVVEAWAAACPRCLERSGTEVLERWIAGGPALPALRDAVVAARPLAFRREVARRALASRHVKVARWGLDQVLGPARDPAVDPPVAAVVASLLEDPWTRSLAASDRAVVGAHRRQFVRLLRADQLDLEGASTLVHLLAGPGHSLLSRYFEHGRDPGPPGPTELRPEDWAAWRRARDAARSPDWLHTAWALPVGPLSAEDRAFVERALVAARAGDAGAVMGVGLALTEGGTKDDLPVVDELVARAPDLEAHRARMRARLGVPTRGQRSPAAATSEWMDGD